MFGGSRNHFQNDGFMNWLLILTFLQLNKSVEDKAVNLCSDIVSHLTSAVLIIYAY